MRVMRSLMIGFAMLLVAGIAAAQSADPRGTAALVVSEGVTYLNDEPLQASGVPRDLPAAAGIRTTSGRAAIALKRGGRLFLDVNSSVRVLANGVYNFNRIEVLAGSAIVTSETSAPVVECESEIRLSSGGVFRFDAQPVTPAGERPCRFRVFDGAAAVPLVSVTNALRAGQMMICNRRCGDMIPTMEFARDQFDEFDRWARGIAGR